MRRVIESLRLIWLLHWAYCCCGKALTVSAAYIFDKERLFDYRVERRRAQEK